jgi:glutathione synthase/RimK-type ligase-like ATP-grasp enzyme
VGLSIPVTLVTSIFSDLLQFANNRKAIILKPLGTAFFEMPITKRYSGHIINKVSFVNYEQLKALEALYPDNSMQPTFAQQYVEKKWEIRSFFLNGTFYSMAIFSQQNERTKVDFRNYDDERPNRCLPFKLPIIIEEKLKSLMSILGMNCGSFDIIYTPQKEYIFLEVNPMGQYQWLDRHCNYFIDRHIANQLLQKETNE